MDTPRIPPGPERDAGLITRSAQPLDRVAFAKLADAFAHHGLVIVHRGPDEFSAHLRPDRSEFSIASWLPSGRFVYKRDAAGVTARYVHSHLHIVLSGLAIGISATLLFDKPWAELLVIAGAMSLGSIVLLYALTFRRQRHPLLSQQAISKVVVQNGQSPPAT